MKDSTAANSEVLLGRIRVGLVKPVRVIRAFHLMFRILLPLLPRKSWLCGGGWARLVARGSKVLHPLNVYQLIMYFTIHVRTYVRTHIRIYVT